jgi:hypothetical protein
VPSETAAIVHRFLLRWHAADPPEAAIAALLAELGPREALPAVLDRVVERADVYRPGELLRALALWHASTDPPAVAAAAPARTGRARVGLGLVLLMIGGDGVRRGWESSPPPRVVVIPITARSEPMPEPRTADGVRFAPEAARRAVGWVNAAPTEALRRAGLSGRAAAAIEERRPFTDIEDVALAPGVGPAAMEAIRRATQ